MTCQHAHASLTGCIGDLIVAMCPCGHWWLICDEWPAKDRPSAFEYAHRQLARLVVPGMVERSEPLRVEVM